MIKKSLDKINLTKQQKDALFLRISESCAASKKKPMKKAIIQYGAIAASVPLVVGGVALAMLFAAPGTLGGPIDVAPVSSQSTQSTSGESAGSNDTSGIPVPVTELKTLEELDLPDIEATYYNAQKEYARIADAECDGYTFILAGKVAVRNKDLYTVSDAKVYMLKDGEVTGYPLDAPSDGSDFMYFSRTNPSDTIRAFSMTELGNDKSPVIAVALSPDGSNNYCNFFGVSDGTLYRIQLSGNNNAYYLSPSKLEVTGQNIISDIQTNTGYIFDLENMVMDRLTAEEAELSAEYVRFADTVNVDASAITFPVGGGCGRLNNKAMCLLKQDGTPGAVAFGDKTADGKAAVTEAHCLFNGTLETDSEGRKYIDVPNAVIKPWENSIRLEGEITMDGVLCIVGSDIQYGMYSPGDILFFPYTDKLKSTLGFYPIKCPGVDRSHPYYEWSYYDLISTCRIPIYVGKLDGDNLPFNDHADISYTDFSSQRLSVATLGDNIDDKLAEATITFTSLEFCARENASGEGSAQGEIKDNGFSLVQEEPDDKAAMTFSVTSGRDVNLGEKEYHTIMMQTFGTELMLDDEMTAIMTQRIKQHNTLSKELWTAAYNPTDPDAMSSKSKADEWFESAKPPQSFTTMRELYELDKSIYSGLCSYESFAYRFDCFKFEEGKFYMKGHTIGNTGTVNPIIDYSGLDNTDVCDYAAAVSIDGDIQMAYITKTSDGGKKYFFSVYLIDVDDSDDYKIVRECDWDNAFGRDMVADSAPKGDPIETAKDISGPVAVTDTSFWKPLGKISLDYGETYITQPNVGENGKIVVDFDKLKSSDIVTDSKIYNQIKTTLEKEYAYRFFFDPIRTFTMMAGADDYYKLSKEDFKKKYLINGQYYEVSPKNLCEELDFTNLKQAYETGKTLYADFSQSDFDAMRLYISEQNGKLCISEDMAYTIGGFYEDYSFGTSAMIAYYTDSTKENIAMLFCVPYDNGYNSKVKGNIYIPAVYYRTYSFEDGVWKRSDGWHDSGMITCNYTSCRGFDWNKLA